MVWTSHMLSIFRCFIHYIFLLFCFFVFYVIICSIYFTLINNLYRTHDFYFASWSPNQFSFCVFSSGYVGLSCPQLVDQLNSVVQQLLQQHVRVKRPTDVMHYSRLLMCLPSLYGTNAKMLETIFCKHISKNTDMEVLLKELLQKVSN